MIDDDAHCNDGKHLFYYYYDAAAAAAAYFFDDDHCFDNDCMISFSYQSSKPYCNYWVNAAAAAAAAAAASNVFVVDDDDCNICL